MHWKQCHEIRQIEAKLESFGTAARRYSESDSQLRQISCLLKQKEESTAENVERVQKHTIQADSVDRRLSSAHQDLPYRGRPSHQSQAYGECPAFRHEIDETHRNSAIYETMTVHGASTSYRTGVGTSRDGQSEQDLA